MFAVFQRCEDVVLHVRLGRLFGPSFLLSLEVFQSLLYLRQSSFVWLPICIRIVSLSGTFLPLDRRNGVPFRYKIAHLHEAHRTATIWL